MKKKTIICKVKQCGGLHYAKGFCSRHYLSISYYPKNREKITAYQRRWRKSHPGYSTPYMHKLRFGGLRELIIQRDGDKCRMCGMTRKEHYQEFGHDITVNHVNHDGRHLLEKNGYNYNDLGSMETLCKRCHGHKDALQHGRYSKYRVESRGRTDVINL